MIRINKYQEALDRQKNNVKKLRDKEFVEYRDDFQILQELVDKETPKKMKKTKKHSWIKDKDGEIDNWQYTCGEYHNGPECGICGYGFCHHCKNEYDDDTCIEHCICDCGNHLKGTEKFCPSCGQKLDWSDK